MGFVTDAARETTGSVAAGFGSFEFQYVDCHLLSVKEVVLYYWIYARPKMVLVVSYGTTQFAETAERPAGGNSFGSRLSSNRFTGCQQW